MIRNHLRNPVWSHPRGVPSLCPLCDGELVARRGEILVWHWAHKARPHARAGCPFEESPWHLRWKLAFERLPDWSCEVPRKIGGRRFIVDVYNARTGAVREFVHSLSPYYVDKHHTLRGHVRDLGWLFDGAAFSSKRQRPVRNSGVRRLLRPNASALQDTIGGLVHHQDELWRRWRGDVWYRVDNSGARRVLGAYAAVDGESNFGEAGP